MPPDFYTHITMVEQDDMPADGEPWPFPVFGGDGVRLSVGMPVTMIPKASSAMPKACGVVRFIGVVENGEMFKTFKTKCLVGVEVDEPYHEGSDGSIAGKYYFKKCAEQQGMFVPPKWLHRKVLNEVEQIAGAADLALQGSLADGEPWPFPVYGGDKLLQISVGTRVVIPYMIHGENLRGTARFIGMVDVQEYYERELIAYQGGSRCLVGIELDAPHPRAGDGKLYGKFYFPKCQKNRAFYLPPEWLLRDGYHIAAAEWLMLKLPPLIEAIKWGWSGIWVPADGQPWPAPVLSADRKALRVGMAVTCCMVPEPNPNPSDGSGLGLGLGFNPNPNPKPNAMPQMNGVVRYIGVIRDDELNRMFKTRCFVGVEVDVPYGGSDGSIAGKYYFSKCADRCGIFVPAENLTVRAVAGPAAPSVCTLHLCRISLGAGACFNQPCDVALDGKGNAIVADMGNSAIRTVFLATAAVSTLAGNGKGGFVDGTGDSARLNFPNGVTSDGNGSVLVTDMGNCSAIRLVAADGTVTTIDPAASVTTAGVAETVPYTTQFNQRKVIFDGEGNAIVSYRVGIAGRRTLCKLATDGKVSAMRTAVGTNGFTKWLLAKKVPDALWNVSPSGVTTDGAGNAYFADFKNCTISMISVDGSMTSLAGRLGTSGYKDGAGADALFAFPRDVAYVAAASEGNANGYVLVADMGNHCIRKIASDGMVTTLAGDGTPGFVDGIGTAARFHSPCGITYDRKSNALIVADSSNHAIRKVESNGTVTTLAGDGTAGFVDSRLSA